jgi:hypothetical protein
MRINIDITGSDAVTTTHTSGSGSQGITAGAHGGAAMGSTDDHAQAPAHVLAEAAATGAINAGPAPAMGTVPSAAPIAISVGGHHGTPVAAASSGGAAPERVFGTHSH